MLLVVRSNLKVLHINVYSSAWAVDYADYSSSEQLDGGVLPLLKRGANKCPRYDTKLYMMLKLQS